MRMLQMLRTSVKCLRSAGVLDYWLFAGVISYGIVAGVLGYGIVVGV
jgi:hypothetical protein